ncbi:MAG: T9SS type A sorting domain-containing protein, partial [Crocinitomicaceae bacterium]
SYTLDNQSTIVNTSPDQIMSYSGVSYPLTYTSTTSNVLINGLVMETSFGGNTRDIYEYDAQNNLVKRTLEFLSSNTWIPLDSTTMTYDLDGNRLTRSTYDVTTLDALTYTDTSEYIAGTNLRTKFISYLPQVFGASLEPVEQFLISYDGSNIEHMDAYFYMPGNGFIWNQRKTYEYNGSTPVKYESYSVVNNTVATSPSDIVFFQSNAQNLHFRDLELTPSGDTVMMNTYYYDSEGFVSKAEFIRLDVNAELYLAQEEFFHYEAAPLGIEEPIELRVSIYPNPSSDVIHVEAEKPINRVQLFNKSGQLVLDQKATDLNIEHLAAGSYLLVGLTDSGRFSKTVVKK